MEGDFMSLGYTGICKKVAEDDYIVIYSYAGENWNDGGKSKRGDSQLQDGMFTIYKSSFCIDMESCMQSGGVKIDCECKNAFQRPGIAVDYLAWMLIDHIFTYYKKNDHFPAQESFVQ